jgi:cytochrome P450
VSKRRTLPDERDFLGCLLSALGGDSDANVADAMISLLTAAPKNTSIAFANMMMFLHDMSGGEALQLQDDAKFIGAALTATLRKTNLVIGSVRVVVGEPLELTASSGASYVLPVGTRVGASHLLRSCPRETDFESLLREGSSESFAFSGGAHLCPGASLAYEMTEAAVRAWIRCGVQFAPNAPPKPPLCFRRATLAQRQAPWIVRIVKED